MIIAKRISGLSLFLFFGVAVLLGLLCERASWARPAKQSGIVETLLPYQSESGLVTRKELRLTKQWLDTVTSESGERPAWLNQWLGTALPFSFQYGGKPSDAFLKAWQLEKAEPKVDPQATRQELVWTDKATGLRLTWQLKRFADYPAVEWELVLQNTGSSDTPILDNLQALDLRLNHSRKGQAYMVHGANGGRSLRDDMIPFSWPLPSPDTNQKELELGGDYPSSNRHLPFFNLETPEDRGVMVGVGWSGNWAARMVVTGNELEARMGLKGAHFVLRPGERVRTPRVLLLFWEGKRLHGHNMLRQLLYQNYVPRLRGRPQEPLASVNVCFTYHGNGGFLHEATEQTLGALVKPFIRIGAEVFIIDAGWYDGAPWDQWMGNWRYSRSKYPRGFRPISDPLAAAKVAFGLWFASEDLSKNAPVIQEHPNLVRFDKQGNPISIRMELPEARDWFLQAVDDLVRKEGMTCYRQDGAGDFGDEAEDRKGITESLHVAGVYELWDTLRSRYPNMVMEGCCGGGRRIDLETLSRFHWHQKADRWYDTESDQCSLYGANLYLPGGVINIPVQATDDYGAWSSFAGQFCLAWHPLDADFPMELARRQVERYKRVRPYLSGDFYPLTPCALDAAYIGYQFHRADSDRGFALLFRRADSQRSDYPASDTFTLRLRGLKPDGNYRVRFESGNRVDTIKGQALAKGIELSVGKPPAAEMITYEPAQ